MNETHGKDQRNDLAFLAALEALRFVLLKSKVRAENVPHSNRNIITEHHYMTRFVHAIPKYYISPPTPTHHMLIDLSCLMSVARSYARQVLRLGDRADEAHGSPPRREEAVRQLRRLEAEVVEAEVVDL